MPSALDLTPEKRFTGLFVGRSGSGKTVAAASFAKLGPMKVFDFDGRIRGILGASWIDNVHKKNISYEYYPPKQAGMIDKLNKDLEALQLMSSAGQLNLTTILVDSLTTQTRAMVMQAMSLTHSQGGKGEKKSGKYVGSIAMAGPEDYGVEAMMTYSLMAFLKSVPVPNIIFTAHVIDRYGKLDPSNPFSESVPIGEKLSVRDKIGENTLLEFDHIFRFERQVVNGPEKFFVRFRTDMARTAYAALPNEAEITGKHFYDFMMEKVRETSNSDTATIAG